MISVYKRNRGRPRRYDWKNLFRKNSFQMMKGKDYLCSTPSIVQQIRNYASVRDVIVKIHSHKDFVIVEVDHSNGNAI